MISVMARGRPLNPPKCFRPQNQQQLVMQPDGFINLFMNLFAALLGMMLRIAEGPRNPWVPLTIAGVIHLIVRASIIPLTK